MENVFDPLTAYKEEYRDRFREVVQTTFAELSDEAKVDVEANRETCRKIYATEATLSSVKGRITCWTVICVVFWVAFAACAIAAIGNFTNGETGIAVATCAGALVSLLLLFSLIHPHLKQLKNERAEKETVIEELESEAWEQMESLNALYGWDTLPRMMTKAMPLIEFDPFFTTQRLDDLRRNYGWDDSFNDDRSVLSLLSGQICGNSFVICRTRKMVMGRKTYHGSTTIYWTTYERDANGKTVPVQHSETLTASVTADYPEYYETTRLIYGNPAAPDLTFSRRKSGLASKDGTLSFFLAQHKLKKKTRDLRRSDFAMMTNEEFEVSFDTSDRNDNQQFALLFTPLAQESMLKLLKDKEEGYGDDFDFLKQKRINTIIPDHIQPDSELDLEMDPSLFQSFDYEKAKADFLSISVRNFRAIYFTFAPLLCVPLYQQMRPQSDIYSHGSKRHRSAFWEHESIANYWGEDEFKDPSCVTHCILKTHESAINGPHSSLSVSAYGYRTVQRCETFSRLGGDGRYHTVDVYWDEYIPVTGEGFIHIKEDNDATPDTATPQQRRDHIAAFLADAGCTEYRRHIASRMG